MSTSKGLRKLVILLAGSAALTYLAFRFTFTINMESWYAIFASAMLLGAEVWGVMLMLLYFFQIWDTSEPEKMEILDGKTVDVFLPTYNEDAQLLRGSINALNQLDYAHTTYVLDDGRRPEVEELCKEMGVEYIARSSNLHAKAGNLNHALDQTDGEFVVIFDADHIAKPNFISRLIGYFRDEQLAFIQTPHAFYNLDNFQGTVNYKSNRYWEEGQLFYNVIQPGKNRWNANVFCGSAAMFRRTALEDVGQVAIETITEDMHTGLRLHARGWKSLYVNERMISAQAAPDVTTFSAQRLRWGEGNLSIFAYDNPLTVPGLTMAQRLNYLGSMLGWTTGLAKIGLYLAPIMMLFSGVSPVGEFSWALLAVTLVYLFSTWSAVKILSNGYGQLWDIELQAMSNFWLQCRAVYRSIVHRGRGKFVVTSKRGTQGTNVTSLIGPHIFLIALGVSAIVWASARIGLGASDDYLGLTVGTVLIALQSILAFQVIRKALRPADKRFSWRHPTTDIHVRYSSDTISGQAVSVDMNETGVGIIAYRPVPVGSTLEVTLKSGDITLTCEGEVRNCVACTANKDGLAAYRVGIQFTELTGDQQCKLWTIASTVAVEKQYDRLEGRAPRKTRREHRLPLEFTTMSETPESFAVVTNQLHATNLQFESSLDIEPHQKVTFEMDGPTGSISGDGVVHRSATDGRYELVFNKFRDQSRGAVKAVVAARRNSHANDVFSPSPRTASWPIVRPVMKCLTISVAASLLCAVGAWYLWQDHYFLSSFAATESFDAQSVSKADALVSRLLDPEAEVASASALFHARGVLEKMGDIERLEQIDALILENHPDNVGVQLASASRLLDRKDYEGALAAFQTLSEALDTPHTIANTDQVIGIRLGLARSHVGAGNMDEAIAAYRTALKLDEDRQATLELANLLVDQGRYAECQELQQHLPEGYESSMIDARLAFFNKDYATGANVLAGLLNDDPTDMSARMLYAEALASLHRTDDAIREFKTLANADYERVDCLKRISQLLITDGRYGEAVVALDAVGMTAVDDDNFFTNYVTAVRRLDRQTVATKNAIDRIYNRAVQSNGKCCIKLKAELAEHFSKQGDMNKAATLLGWCMQEQPENLAYRKRYAEVLHNAGRYAEADRQYAFLLTRIDSVPNDLPAPTDVIPTNPTLPPATPLPPTGPQPPSRPLSPSTIGSIAIGIR